ncbi:proline dehydrogenase KNAG_0A02880 [Huiozyma naganishii CBS 8797]|uniref:Proline dehydrogenase n=1 Tax=Huiozyma naganishii (strain ATCC MYA-139 / BCRC 22969 / CBS 8797 / KCTC 17520 / NBRC 10181 / NCYC 3082 / Yp74L-3) TaxID=1071383 RepID=J7RTE8_HUIN7|nr:hypothetical protein KNAG_0A02880 [Kazachstania naganishii CBS 8797]CCK67977.1 hypothetical protein KNAG_0A02880 [Kazachstania naganishii CBS 8797]
MLRRGAVRLGSSYSTATANTTAAKVASLASLRTELVYKPTARFYVTKTATKKETQLAVDAGGAATTAGGHSVPRHPAVSGGMADEAMHVHTADSQVPTPSVYDAPIPSAINFLKSVPRKQLLSLFVIGVCSLNKFVLDTCIKVFPFVPVPIIRLLISDLYCGGETMKQVTDCGAQLQKRGISNMMLSLTIEDSEGTKNIDINHIVDETIQSIHQVLRPNLESQLEKCTPEQVNDIAPGYIALKPSALVKDPAQVLLNFNNPEPYWQAQRQVLIDNCSKITEEIYNLNQEFAKKYPNRVSPFFVSTIDAEKFDLQLNGVYDLQRVLMQKFNPVDAPCVSVIGTWQLYLTDSYNHLFHEYKLAKQYGYKLGLKIVRGAYIHSEANRSEVIHPTKEATDKNYDHIMQTVISDMINKGSKSFYGHLVIASHNYHSQLIATNILDTHKSNKFVNANVILGQLLGMADNVTYDLVHTHHVKNIIKYVPWGPANETKDYLLRRLQENGDAVRSDNGWPLIKNIMLSLSGSK